MLLPEKFRGHQHRHSNHQRSNPLLAFGHHYFGTKLSTNKAPTAMVRPISHTGKPARIKNSRAAIFEVKLRILVRAVASTKEKCPSATKQSAKIEPVPGPKSHRKSPRRHRRTKRTSLQRALVLLPRLSKLKRAKIE